MPALTAAGFRCFRPRGAYYVMTDISAFGFKDDVSFAKYLVQEIGVAVCRDPASIAIREMARSRCASPSAKSRETLGRSRTQVSEAAVRRSGFYSTELRPTSLGWFDYFVITPQAMRSPEVARRIGLVVVRLRVNDDCRAVGQQRMRAVFQRDIGIFDFALAFPSAPTVKFFMSPA